VSYDLRKEQATLEGLPGGQGFAERPQVSIGHWIDDLPVVNVSLFPLKIRGEVQRLDKQSGVLRTRFIITQPVLLSEKELASYMNDRLQGYSYYRIRIACKPTKGETKPRDLVLTLGKEPGCIGQLEGWTEDPLDVRRIEYLGPDHQTMVSMQANLPPDLAALLHKERETQWSYRIFCPLVEDEYLVVQFDVGAPPDGKGVHGHRDNTTNVLLYTLHDHDVRGKASVFRNKAIQEITTFTAALDRVLYRALDEARTPPRQDEPKATTQAGEERIPEDYVECESGIGEEIGPDTEDEQADGRRWLSRSTALAALIVIVAIGLCAIVRRRLRR